MLGDLLNLKNSSGISGTDFTKGAGALIPIILSQLNKKAQDPNEIDSLDEILSKHQDDDFNNSSKYIDELDNNEKETMIDSILGGNRAQVEKEVAQKSGLDEATIKKLLYTIAPLVLMYMSKTKKEKNLKKEDIKIETSILNKTAKDNGLIGSLTGLLDKDGDGNILDDLLKF